MSDITKAKVMAINRDSVSVLTLTGPYRNRLYALAPRRDLQVDQFVDVVIGPAGQSAHWSEGG